MQHIETMKGQGTTTSNSGEKVPVRYELHEEQLAGFEPAALLALRLPGLPREPDLVGGGRTASFARLTCGHAPVLSIAALYSPRRAARLQRAR